MISINKKVSRSVVVDEDFDIELKKIAAEKKTDKSRLYVLGAKILIEIMRSEELEGMLRILLKDNPELEGEIRELLR